MAKKIITFLSRRAVIVCGALCVIPFVFFWGMYPLVWKYMANTAEYMPYIALVLLHLPLVLWAINVLFVRDGKFNVAILIYSILATLGYALLCFYILSVLFFVFTEIVPIITVVVLAFTVVFVFFSGRATKRCRKTVGSLLAVIFGLYAIFGLFNLKPNYINADPVVFAVGDEYQICWSTSVSATGVVEIGGRRFYDGANGVANASTIHKVAVPRALLDGEKSYTVKSASLLTRRTYLSTVGNEAKKSFAFKPVDASDGLKFYSFSDNHMQRTGVTRASGYFGDALDFVVANGDQFNNISHEYQVTLVYRILSGITKSAIPVIMTRGNHETVGSIVDRADEFLPSREGKFYYTVDFADTRFIVLDYATDHSDDEAVTRPSHFEDYRARELEWFETVANDTREDESIKNVVALCHVSFLRLGSRTQAEQCFQFARLCESAGVDLLICGHSHILQFLEPGEEYNCTNFIATIGSIRNDRFANRDGISEFQFTGTAVEINDNNYVIRFTNSKREVVEEHFF